jgi:hypothetical protein
MSELLLIHWHRLEDIQEIVARVPSLEQEEIIETEMEPKKRFIPNRILMGGLVFCLGFYITPLFGTEEVLPTSLLAEWNGDLHRYHKRLLK